MRINKERLSKLPKHERKLAERALADLTRVFEDNPLYSYHPHFKQHAFHQSRARTKAFFGGNRSGKTHASIADDLIQAVDEDCLPDHLKPYKKWQPPFYCRIVSPDFTSTMEGVIFNKLRELVPKSQLVGGKWGGNGGAYDKQLRMLRFKNGSWFQFLTSEQDIDKFSGAALHRVHYDEEPPGEKGRQIRQENLMRLIDYGGDEVFSMTPLLGLSWTYESVWEKRGPEIQKDVYESPDLFIVTVDMDENPHLDQKMKETILGEMSEKEREARKKGRFVHFAGLVYDEFNPDKHVCEPVSQKQLQGQAIYVGIDPGIKTTAVSFCAFDRDNTLLVFDELYLGEQSAIPENASKAIFEKLTTWGNPKVSYFLIDPSARNRALVNADNVQAAYLRAGIHAYPGQNQLEAGVFEVKRRFETQQLVIARNCQRLLWEISRYRVHPRDDGQFAVVKQNDHLLDSLRYVAMARPLAPQRMRQPAQQRDWIPGTAPAWDGGEVVSEVSPMGAAF